MSYVFPTSPTNGQKFTPVGGPTFIWNGTAWASSTVGGGNPWSSLVLNGSTSGTETLVASAIAGTNTATFPARTANVMLDGPAFAAYGTAYQSAANVTAVKIAYNTEVFDTNSCYNTTLYRFTPNVAGYYYVTASLSMGPTASSGCISASIWINGSGAVQGNQIPFQNLSNISGTVSRLTYLNGTTDYVEAYGFQVSGGTFNIGSPDSAFQFSGYLVRGA
jgi:hypothetical protein